MATGCGDVIKLEDLQTAKKHQLFEAEVITGKQGGVAGGADIDYATNQVTGQTQKTLPAVLRDAGFTPASFDFTTGGTLSATDRDKAVYDPVSKTWYVWQGTLPHVIAAGTNPVGDVNWKPWTDPTLRDDLASTATGKGDALVAVKQPYTGSVGTTQHEVNRRIVSISDFLTGVETDHSAALLAAAQAAGSNGIIRFPRSSGSSFNFATTSMSVLDNITLDVDPGITFTVPDAGYLSNKAHWERVVDVNFTNGSGTAVFQYTPATRRRAANRPFLIDMDNRDASRWVPIKANADLQYFAFNQNDDSRNAAAVSSSDYAFAVDNVDVNITKFGMLKCYPGESLNFAPDSATLISVSVAGIIQCEDRRYWFWSNGNNVPNLTPQVATKAIGQGVTVESMAYQGMHTHASYFMYNSLITIRIDSRRRFTVLLNGYAVHTQETPSDILEYGCGIQGIGQLTLKDMTVHKGVASDTGRYMPIATWGDSLTGESMPTTWPRILEDMLDASNGVRLSKVDNYAVPGAGSADQLAAMDSVAVGNYNYHFILIGTNDIQGQSGVAAYISNVHAMINNILNNGSKVVLGIPPMWYTQSQLPGGGGGAVNYEKGSLYRSALIREVASWNSPRVRLVDLTAVTGPVLADFRNTTTNPDLANQKKDPAVYDCLHLTQNTQFLVARAFAKALMGDISDNGTGQKAADVSLVGIGSSSWVVASTSKYRRLDNRTININLLINSPNGSAANNVQVAQLPRALWPREGESFVVAADGTQARVTISTAGVVVLYGLSGGNFIHVCATYCVS